MSKYDFKEYLSFMAIINRLRADDYRNYIQIRFDANPDLQGKKQSWEQWKQENIDGE